MGGSPKLYYSDCPVHQNSNRIGTSTRNIEVRVVATVLVIVIYSTTGMASIEACSHKGVSNLSN